MMAPIMMATIKIPLEIAGILKENVFARVLAYNKSRRRKNRVACQLQCMQSYSRIVSVSYS